MIRTLTLIYNKARQEQITKELLDIVGGVEAMNGARRVRTGPTDLAASEETGP